MTSADIKRLQAMVGVAQDGKLGTQTIKAVQAYAGLKVDGVNGPNTTKAIAIMLASAAAPAGTVASTAPMSADALAAAWDALGKQWDTYSNRVTDKSISSLIMQALADWQDFYFGHAGNWPAPELARWTQILSSTRQTLESAVKPSQTSVQGQTFVVTAKPPISHVRFDVSKLKLIGAALGVVGAVGLAVASGKSSGSARRTVKLRRRRR
jgi:lysozyme family protein